MTTRAHILAGIAALLATPAAAQVTDYRLPPAPTPTPTPPPIVGPVLGNGPVSRPTPSPTPSPTPAPTQAPPVTEPPAPSPTALPRNAVPALPTPTPSPIRRAPPAVVARPSPTPTAPATPTTVAPSSEPSASPAPALPTSPPSLAPPGSTVSAPAEQGRSYWPWVVFVFLLGGAGFAAAFWLRRRIGPTGAVTVPPIERPRVPPPPPHEPDPLAAAPAAKPLVTGLAPEWPAPAPAAKSDPLQISIELRKLTITLMNATLSYRLTLSNAGGEPLKDVTVAADLIGAHSSLPREAQLAGPASELPERHRLAGIAVGESGEVVGELRLPLSELRPIVQGRTALFVPLARFRIGARGREPRWFTLVAGQPSPSGNGAVQPVRLDLGPRIYDGLAGRAF